MPRSEEARLFDDWDATFKRLRASKIAAGVVAQVADEAGDVFDFVGLSAEIQVERIGYPGIAFLTLDKVETVESPRVVVVMHGQHGRVPDHLGVNVLARENLTPGRVTGIQWLPTVKGKAEHTCG